MLGMYVPYDECMILLAFGLIQRSCEVTSSQRCKTLLTLYSQPCVQGPALKVQGNSLYGLVGV